MRLLAIFFQEELCMEGSEISQHQECPAIGVYSNLSNLSIDSVTFLF